MLTEQMRLDGNAAGGALREIFVHDMTAALVTCSACGAARPMGALLEYGQPMGVILRCPGCDTPMVRINWTSSRLWLDVSGLGMLVVDDADHAAADTRSTS